MEQSSSDILQSIMAISRDMPAAMEDIDEQLWEAWDDVTGKEIESQRVQEPRQEIECIHKSQLHTKVPRKKAQDAAAKVVSLRRIDINKDDPKNNIGLN